MPKPKTLRTNTDLVNDLMTFGGPHGPLTEVFVMTAIQKYAEQCIAAGPERFESSLMNGKAWVATAEDVKKRLDAFYKRHDPVPAPESAVPPAIAQPA